MIKGKGYQKVFRLGLTFIGLVLGFGLSLLIIFALNLLPLSDPIALSQNGQLILQVAIVIITGLIFFILSPRIQRGGLKVAHDIETDLQLVPTNDLAAGTAGLVLGLVIAFLISQLWSSLGVFGIVLSVITYVFLAYLGMTIAMKKGRDVFAGILLARRSRSGGVAKGRVKGRSASPKILDTSVIIDGRIYDIMRTGFIEGNIVIPDFVLVELQHISDSADALKRNRGRRGLDILNKLQEQYGIEIRDTSADKAVSETMEVDAKLLKLSQIMNGKVMTNDYNLNKVATIQGVEVLNINELANTLKPIVLPGEDMTLKLVKEGKENSQALAYLDDGTMIVVEEGRRFIGKTIDVTVTSVLQTSAGRMIFAKPKTA